jgi:hypothetical protein
MSLLAAYEAGIRNHSPARDAVKLREMPTRAPGPLAIRGPKKTRRLERPAFDYRRWMPPDIESALSGANGGGNLFHAATIAAWVKSHPVVAGVLEGRTSTPWLPPGVMYSEEAAAWILGSKSAPGWRERITDPSELESIALDDYNAGYGLGCFVWNKKLGQPELLALDNAGLRYIPGEDRYQYYGFGTVFDVEPGNSIWVMKTRVKTDPWRDGAWHKIAYKICNSELAEMQRSVWMQIFGMPTVLAESPLGASDDQKLNFTQKVIGAALRVIGVTPGYKMTFNQASAEGSDTFAQAMTELERAVSILVWGTLGLISGGSGFSNSDLFERMKAAILEKEARKQARFENEQIWPVVLDWAYRAGKISKAARNACIVYNAESAAVIQQKATAAKALMEAGYSAEEAQRRVGLEKHSMPEAAPESGVRLPPGSREEEPEEPGYSEALASKMTERALEACPHGETRSCRSCRVVRRFEVQDGADPYRPVWHPWTRRAA